MNKYQFEKKWMMVALIVGLVSSYGSLALAIEKATDLKPLSAASAPAAQPTMASHPDDESLASQAGDDFSSGAKGLGGGFKKGAKLTGRAFKTAGQAMGQGFKKAGSSIRDYFVGKKEAEIEEVDLRDTAAESNSAGSARSEALDAVGNDV